MNDPFEDEMKELIGARLEAVERRGEWYHLTFQVDGERCFRYIEFHSSLAPEKF
jgi:hypothetical protein